MNRTLLLTFFLSVFLGCHVGVAWAKSVVVLPTEYIDMSRGGVDAKSSADFDEILLETIQEAGWTGVSREEVSNAVASQSENDVCDETCMAHVRTALGADEAVHVKVLDNSDTYTRTVTISFAIRNQIVVEYTDGYEVVKSEVRRKVALALKEDAPSDVATAAPPKADAASPSQKSSMPEGKEGHTTVEVVKAKPYKKFGPLPFIISSGATVAFGITTLVMDMVAHRNYKDLKKKSKDPLFSKSKFENELDKVENQQLTMKIFLAATAAGVVTTGVLAIFTDFSKPLKKQSRITPALVFGKDSGAVLIGGSF